MGRGERPGLWVFGGEAVAGVLFPEGLALMAAGPDLGALLAEVYPHRASFTHQQSCDLAVAAARQANSYRAMSLSCTLDTALRTSAAAPGARAARPHRCSAPLVGLLLGRSDRSAGIETGFGHDLEVRVPGVLAAFLAGDISEQAARAYCEATAELPEDLARQVARDVLADPDTVIPADIRDQIARLAIAADPGHAEKVLAAALDKRDVCSARRADGTADLTARHMPLEHAAASTATVSALVKAARRAGDTRPVGGLREEIAHGLLTRAYDGLTDAHIGALLAGDCPTRPVLHPDNGPDHDEGPDHPGPSGGGPDDPDPGPSGGGPDDPDGDGPVHDEPGAHPDDDQDSSDLDYGDLDYGDPAGPMPDPPPGPFATPDPPLAHPGAGIDLRIDLATLLHHDENPAELLRFGPIPAPVARHLTHTESAGQWRFALLDTRGHLIATDLLTTRPPGHRRRSPTNRASIEILLTTEELHDLTTSGTDPAWAPLITEIHRRTRTALGRPPPDPTRRFSDARLRRHITTRTPRCTWPYCREPAITSEIDHTLDHAKGGPTDTANQWPRCRKHHALKSRFGWQITITGPHTYTLTSHLHTAHPVTLPPTRKPLPQPKTDWASILDGILRNP